VKDSVIVSRYRIYQKLNMLTLMYGLQLVQTLVS